MSDPFRCIQWYEIRSNALTHDIAVRHWRQSKSIFKMPILEPFSISLGVKHFLKINLVRMFAWADSRDQSLH